jgi:solute carrier family 7 (L-type amino acid transporter), member 5
MTNVKIMSKIQTVLTTLKIIALLTIITTGFYNFYKNPVRTNEMVASWFENSNFRIGSISMAFYNGLFSYSGW